MALEADAHIGVIERPAPPAPGLLGFWGWKVALAIEAVLFATWTAVDGVGHAISVTVAGLIGCAVMSFVALQRSQSPLGVAARRLARKKIAMISLAFILLFYLSAVLAPVLPLPSYTHQDLGDALKAPSLSHPFGTDRLGRDLLSRCIWASQTTMIVTVASLVAGSLVLSVGLGLWSGYAGGLVDSVIMRIGDVFAGLPTLLMVILINATLKDRIHSLARTLEKATHIGGIVSSGAADYLLIFGAISIFGWVGGARVIRSQVLALRETEFILAAKAIGATTPRILFRQLLPNVTNYLIVSMSLGLATIAGSEIALTFFGVGIQPPHPSFGALVFDGSGVRQLNKSPWLLGFPAGIVMALYFAFNLLGDALSDILTPKAN
jgi:peptide/nickel transport system ATP-binding protein